MLSHVFTIILHHFYAFCRTNLLTRCPVPVPCFVLILLQKVTSGNILGIGRKFTMIFYYRNEEGSQKDDSKGPTQPGAAPCRGPGSTRRWDPPLPCGAPLGRLRRLSNHPRRKNPNPRRIFPNTIQSFAAIADKFRGSDCLFWPPAGTGIGPRSHLRHHRCLRDEL